MKNVRKIITFVLLMCFMASMSVTVFAYDPYVRSTKSKTVEEFSKLTGYLYESSAAVDSSNNLDYSFGYKTVVTTLPSSSAKLVTTVECQNNATGSTLKSTAPTKTGVKYMSGYVDMSNFSGVRGGASNISVGVFIAHEARCQEAYLVRTNAVFNLYKDHGIT